jgi:type II secretory pathway pseudopilin PulG
MKPFISGRTSTRGITLVELLVMSVIASLVAVTIIQSFSGITKGILGNRFKTLATQLANENMQSLKGIPYYRLRVSSLTTTPTGCGAFSPPVLSDDGNYPPVVTVLGGTSFTVYTIVQRVQKSAAENLTVVAWNAPDTGVKQITVSVAWMERNAMHRVQLVNLRENFNRLTANGQFIGRVLDVSNAVVANPLIEISEDPSFRTMGDASGNYLLEAPVGSYTLRAYKRGYFSQSIANNTITSSAPVKTVNFNGLIPMSSGTVTGSVWHSDHLVISRVCAEIMNVGTSQEYVEIFNPTTWTWTVDGQYGLYFQGKLAQASVSINSAPGGNNIAPGGFYLFGSHSPLVINGFNITPDAVWENTIGGLNDTNANFPYFTASDGKYNVIPNNADGAGEGVGSLTLYQIAGGATIDRVGWQGGGSLNPSTFETAPVPDVNGIESNEIYYRKTTPAGGFSTTVGPAYDSGNNSLDWGVDPGAPHTLPRNTATATPFPIVSGVPSFGARVFANDGLSLLVIASSGPWSPPEAKFTLPNIATGTWTVSASTRTYFVSFSTTVTANVTISTSLVLNTPTVYGFVSGTTRTPGQIVPNMSLLPGNGYSDINGFFRIALPVGLQTVKTNPSKENPSFRETSSSFNVKAGIETATTIMLSESAIVSGLVSVDGSTPLPGIPVRLTNSSGNLQDMAPTDGDGIFRLNVGGAATYTVQVVTPGGETVSPATLSATVSSSNTRIFVGTFTVTSSLGALAGSVSYQSKRITTGVYIIASTTTVPADPPVLNQSFRTVGAAYNSGLSNTDGSYSMSLPPGTYNVAAWYTVFNGDVPSVTRKDFPNVVVSANANTTLNMSW